MVAVWTALVRPSESPASHDWAVSASGTRVQFADGVDAYCATSGLWNVPLGYGREEIAEAVARALRDASYLTLFRRGHPLAEEAAQRLIAFAGGSYERVIYSTAGSSANDVVMKLVRQFWQLAGSPQRRIVVGLRGSYHGLTYGSHGLSGDELGQGIYGVDQRDIRHVPFHDSGAALETLVKREGNRIAALVLEPVLGTGAVAVPSEFLSTVERLREEHGFLLVADEVATGFGRTGVRFASNGWTRSPDALVLSKALTNGTCAASTILVGRRIVAAFDRDDALFVHGETQAGTPASCAAILATADLYESLDVDARFRELTGVLDGTVARLLTHDRVTATHGAGAFRAVTVDIAGSDGNSGVGTMELVERIRKRGVIVHPGPSAIQLTPAAVSTAADLDFAASAIEEALNELDAA
ncbi:aspartate aminotransferase family protein [Rathayibacter rathayi]|uniref:daptide-type RiPP biosynthesis aminotransferase n=1 Tax=Rathayibacter rathayi TaxID=33887 RepID=UPI000CE76687|nr:daptide-type RiPP biosynthesis aminotransferase [Rathayibacter rathayi]PPG67577.1 aspartate aminotransferase family protein [Rathayibacter rathayi]PPG76564.1 aspartate aminotransferase family protein [Rathayibacter rathayi]PPH22252.1 aspartate aminotransferase family protein [Rathayibacter rathayi]PPH36996.1 aspartate aminotransferase family protein [Rathayibacter rathayi]PPH64286.1 aspartate aminotransferase family protein [Rathayibacter rathayi]